MFFYSSFKNPAIVGFLRLFDSDEHCVILFSMMDKQNMKFRVNFIQEIALERKHTVFRYYVGMCLFDLSGQGWVSKSDFVPFIAKQFNASEKTVKNNLQKLHTLKWVNNTPDRVYYRNQEFILSTMHPHHRTNKAVYISMDNIGGDIVDFRAFVHEATIAGQIKDGSVTIARDTIREQVNGHGRKTQRKYEKMRHVKSVYNFARLNGDDQLELIYKLNQPVFPVLPEDVDDDLYFVRQLPNSYTSNIKIGKRIRLRKYGISNNQMPNDKCVKLYFDRDDDVKNIEQSGYIKTNDKLNHNDLWSEVSLG